MSVVLVDVLFYRYQGTDSNSVFWGTAAWLWPKSSHASVGDFSPPWLEYLISKDQTCKGVSWTAVSQLSSGCLCVSFPLLHPDRILHRGLVAWMCLVPRSTSWSHVVRMDSAGWQGCMHSRIYEYPDPASQTSDGVWRKRDFLSSWLCKSAMGDHDFILSIPARSRAKEHKAVCKYKSKPCWAMKDKLQLSIAVQLSIYCAYVILGGLRFSEREGEFPLIKRNLSWGQLCFSRVLIPNNCRAPNACCCWREWSILKTSNLPPLLVKVTVILRHFSLGVFWMVTDINADLPVIFKLLSCTKNLCTFPVHIFVLII